MGQHLLISGVLWGFSLDGWTGILRLPGVQSFCPRGASCTHRSFPPAQGQGIGRVDVPHSGSDRWGGDLACPSHSQEHQTSPTPPTAVFVQSCLCLFMLHTLAVPPPLQPVPLHQGGQQGCRQEPFADSEDFLREWTNLWLILLARGLGSRCGGLRSLLLLWLVEAGGCQ